MGKRQAVDFDDDLPNKRIKYSSNTSVQNASITPCNGTDFVLTKELVYGTVLTDLSRNKWKVGKPIGKGSFGEIFLASNDTTKNVTQENAKYVAKIERHTNGPLFVEIHCLLNTGKCHENEKLPPGMPEYIASGSHYFNGARYRFLILKRFQCDLHSIIKDRCIDPKNILIIGCQLIDILQHIHDKGYAHSDIKAENMMIGKCSYDKSINSVTTTTTTNITQIVDNGKRTRHVRICDNQDDDDDDEDNVDNDEDDNSDDSEYDEDTNINKTEIDNNNDDDSSCEMVDDDDEEDDGSNGNSSVNESDDNADEDDDDDDDDNEDEDDDEDSGFKTPKRNNNRSRLKTVNVEFSGTNPLRSCRMIRKTSMYDDMIQTHYLRPIKKINYSLNIDGDDDDINNNDDDEEDEDYFDNKLSSSFINNNNNNTTTTNVNIITPTIMNTIHVTENHIYLIDFGLASKFIDSSGQHRPYCMDQRRAHDGTIEFTSRDAHMGAHSRRSDLECLGFNLIYWSQGTLPWKDAKIMSQPEEVHRLKEILMTDVRDMLKLIYGNTVPQYLGEFLHYVSKLAYHERPDYEQCKKIFINEFISLGYNQSDMTLDLNLLKKSYRPNNKWIKKQNDMRNKNFNGKKMKSLMKLSTTTLLALPFKENLSNRISPKNLRSKSEKIPKKQRKKFSWTEILSTDPDQIARKRADKEYERDQVDATPILHRYKGKPTYAILEIENKIKFRDRLDIKDENEKNNDNNLIKGYTKPMMDVLRKRQIFLMNQLDQRKNHNNSNNNNSNNNLNNHLSNQHNTTIDHKLHQSSSRVKLRKHIVSSTKTSSLSSTPSAATNPPSLQTQLSASKQLEHIQNTNENTSNGYRSNLNNKQSNNIINRNGLINSNGHNNPNPINGIRSTRKHKTKKEMVSNEITTNLTVTDESSSSSNISNINCNNIGNRNNTIGRNITNNLFMDDSPSVNSNNLVRSTRKQKNISYRVSPGSSDSTDDDSRDLTYSGRKPVKKTRKIKRTLTNRNSKLERTTNGKVNSGCLNGSRKYQQNKDDDTPVNNNNNKQSRTFSRG